MLYPHGADWIGYLAALLVFCSFYARTVVPLRLVAIASNLAFIAYASAKGLHPVLVLHAVLLPLNCVRLLQLRALRKGLDSRRASGGSEDSRRAGDAHPRHAVARGR